MCELVVTVCTLVYLFNLQQTIDSGQEKHMGHGSREMALVFLSLGFTVATLVVWQLALTRLHRVVEVSGYVSVYTLGPPCLFAGPRTYTLKSICVMYQLTQVVLRVRGKSWQTT